MINLIPGKLYRANTGIWGVYWETHDSVFVDSNEVLLFVEKPDGGPWRNFLNLDGDVIFIHKINCGSLVGPL